MPEAKTDQRAAPPRFEELLARAEALIPVLRERAPRAEQLRRLPDETIADLHSSGLFRMLQPARVGGSELPYRALYELTAVIGQGCGSTSWVLANLAAHHWLLGMWHPEAQDEIWGESPDSLISSALIFARGPRGAWRAVIGSAAAGRFPAALMPRPGICSAPWSATRRPGRASTACFWCRRATTRSSTPGT
jgi:alkylation response protein AidB-like acyl-CoA dehydrogenase